MDLLTLISVVLVFVAVFASMILEGASPMHIILIPPLILIFVGGFGASAAGLMMSDLKIVGNGMKRAFTAPMPDASEMVDVIVKMADRARREGLLALEDMAKEITDPLLKEGIQMTVDGTDASEIEELLSMRIQAKKEEDKIASKFFENMGGYAPTIGVVGAIIGLIHALGNLDDVGALGHMIASAFVATLWGVLIANGMWLPLAIKIKRLGEIEVKNMEMLLEGVLAVQAGTSPRVVEQKLRSALPGGGESKAKKAA